MTKDAYHAIVRPPKGNAPMVVALHGTGGDENQFITLTEQIVPDAGIISPLGDVSEYGAARFFKRTAEGVYDMVDLARATKKMADFIAAHCQDYPDSPVYAYGYSNGANILANILFHYPGLIKRAALLHPLIPFTPPAEADVSATQVLITAGKHDPICPWPGTQALADYFRHKAKAFDLVAHTGRHEIRQEELSALSTFLHA